MIFLSANLGDVNRLRRISGYLFTNNPGQGGGSGGTCSDDSGGPPFWIDPDTRVETNIVMAVNSYSITSDCNGTDNPFRTDIKAAQDIVMQYLYRTP